jgi:hypothetical protein
LGIFLKRTDNSGTGATGKIGGKIWDYLMDFFSDTDITSSLDASAGGAAKINTPTIFRDDRLKLYDSSGNSKVITISTPSLTADRQLSIPVLTGSDTISTLGTVHNLPADYYVYKVSSTYYAVDTTTNLITSNASFGSLLSSINLSGKCIELGSGDFTLTSQYVGTVSKCTIKGQGIGLTKIVYDSSMTGSGAGFVYKGSIGSAYNLSADATAGSHTISTASTAGIVAGDWIYLQSNTNIDAGQTTRYQAEIHKVNSVTSTVVTLQDNTGYTYNTSDTAKFYKITWAEEVTFSDLSFYDARATVSGITEQADTLFLFCKDLLLQNVKFDNMVSACCGVQNCLDWHVNNMICDSPRETSAADGIRYGLYSLSANTNGTVIGLKGQRCRHTFTTNTVSGQTYGGGRRINTKLIGCQSFNADTAGFDTHESDIGISFVGCGATNGYPGNVTTDTKGFNTRSPTNFTDCWAYGYMAYASVVFNNNDSAGTDSIPGGDRTSFINCRFGSLTQASGVGKAIRIGSSSTSNRSSIIIKGCQFWNVPDQNIQIDGGSKNIIISGNIFHSCGADLNSSSGLIQVTGTATDLIVTENIFGAGTAPANARPLYVTTSVDRCIFKDNDCNGLTNKMPTIPAASTDVRINDNLGLNPINVIATPINTTNNTIGSYGGTTATPTSNVDYKVVGGTMYIGVQGGTGVSVTVKDGAGNTCGETTSTLTARPIPAGFKINIVHSGAPTVTVLAT